MNNQYNMDMFGDFKQSNMDSTLKLPICLVLDKSGSMSERTGSVVKINELNENVQRFLDFVKNDFKASRICDLSIIGFGGDKPEVIFGYSKVDKIVFKPLKAGGGTPMGAAIDLAIDLLLKRRQFYKENGIEHYKPIMMIMSDGEPTDQYDVAANRCSEMVSAKRLKVYPVGIGKDFNTKILTAFSPELPPKRISDMQGFMKLFELLSKSSSNPKDDSIDKWFMDSL